MDSGSTSLRPPVLAPQILQDNSSVDHYFDLNGKGGAVTIKNIYLTGVRADQTILGWSDGIRVNADSVKVTLKGDIFSTFTHSAITFGGKWDKFMVTDCTFRNNIFNGGAYFGGGAFLGGGVSDPMDTTIFMNNTFFCNNSYIFDIRGYCPNAVFSHNTLVYGTVDPFLTMVAQNLRMSNNLFYGMHSYGGNPIQLIDQWLNGWPDTTTSSIVQVEVTDTTSPWYYLWGDSSSTLIPGPDELQVGSGGTGNAQVTAADVTPSTRLFHLMNNDYFWPQALYDGYKAYNDTVTAIDTVIIPNYTTANAKAAMVRKLYLPSWIGPYASYSISKMDSSGANVNTSGNMNMDPGFSTDIQNQFSQLMNYVYEICTSKFDTAWYYYGNNTALYPPAWPLPENLAYSNTTLQSAGTDGFALGDLNWFPSQKTQWLAAGGTTTGIKKLSKVPSQFNLSNNYPNPFNPSTTIKFSLASAGNVTLQIYNITGQLVKTVINNESMSKGEYSYSVSLNNFASGVYFYRLQQGANVMTKKMVLLK
jgi:hypothetical protein